MVTNTEMLENLVDDLELYLSMDTAVKTGSIIKGFGNSKNADPILDLILIKEDLYKRIAEETRTIFFA